MKRFTDDLKREALNAVNNGETYGVVSRRYGCSPQAIRLWKAKIKTPKVTQKAQPVTQDAKSTETDKPEFDVITKLRTENLRLKAVIGELYLSSRSV